LAIIVNDAEVILRTHVPLFCGFAEPNDGLNTVTRRSQTPIVHDTKAVLRVRVPLFGCPLYVVDLRAGNAGSQNENEQNEQENRTPYLHWIHAKPSSKITVSFCAKPPLEET
jgi:hypothetical protein